MDVRFAGERQGDREQCQVSEQHAGATLLAGQKEKVHVSDQVQIVTVRLSTDGETRPRARPVGVLSSRDDELAEQERHGAVERGHVYAGRESA
jgi:hypothetical protein